MLLTRVYCPRLSAGLTRHAEGPPPRARVTAGRPRRLPASWFLLGLEYVPAGLRGSPWAK
jgi:hypothetical protein